MEAVNCGRALCDSVRSSASDACDDDRVTTIGGMDMGKTVPSFGLTWLIGNCLVAAADSSGRPHSMAEHSNGLALMTFVCFVCEFDEGLADGHATKSTTSIDVSSIRMRGVSDFLRSTR